MGELALNELFPGGTNTMLLDKVQQPRTEIDCPGYYSTQPVKEMWLETVYVEITYFTRLNPSYKEYLVARKHICLD